MNTPKIERYMFLMQEFVGGSLTANQFETEYLDLFKSDETIWEEKVFLVLDKLFSDVDSFCAESSIRRSGDLNEADLRDAARDAYEKISKMTQLPLSLRNHQ